MKVGLLVSEFFARELRSHNNIGGYGMLARHYIAEHLPCDDIEVETVIGFNDLEEVEVEVLDGYKKLVFLPGFGPRYGWSWFKRFFVERILRRKGYFVAKALAGRSYDGYLSVEFQNIARTVMRAVPAHKLVLWLQDPRPQSEWDEIDTVGIRQRGYRPSKKVRAELRRLREQGRLVVVSQGEFLKDKGRELYAFDEDVEIETLLNPVEVDTSFDVAAQKKEDTILFLGRLDSVKRPWLFYELAKRMPEYRFVVCGEAHESEMSDLVDAYRDVGNLEFRGHTTGDEKTQLLERSKLLVNTSIHEAIPLSFLEALACGCLLVSCQPSDGLTARFGRYMGRVLGQGRESLDSFEAAIRDLLGDETRRQALAREAVEYVRTAHSVERFQESLRRILRENFPG
jgi:glycosyltransferase involved in cell wall biosynthesis